MKGFASFLTAAVLSAFGGSATTTPTAIAKPCVDITRTLSVGSRGGDVGKLQTFLGVEKTEYFGQQTRQKLLAWQLSQKIISSAKTAGAGTTGPRTRAAMKCSAVLPAQTQPLLPTVPAAATAATSSSTTTPATSSVPTAPVLQSSGGGGGGASVSPYGYTCGPLGEKPAASTCTTGIWEKQFDEAGCDVWACTYEDERG